MSDSDNLGYDYYDDDNYYNDDIDNDVPSNSQIEQNTEDSPEPTENGRSGTTRSLEPSEEEVHNLKATAAGSSHEALPENGLLSSGTELQDKHNLMTVEPAITQRPSQRFTKPIKIIVDSPQKVSEGPSAFISYLITAEFSAQPTTRVRRRFSDFVKLYNELVETYPGCAIPPLPEFSRLEYIAGDRFSSEFTSRRAASLDRFMFRLLQHPEFGTSRIVAAFITPRDSGSTDAFHGISGARPHITGEGGVIDLISDSLLNAFSKVKYQSREMVEAKERADRFEHNVAAVDKSFLRVSRRQTEIIHGLSDFHKLELKMAMLEPTSQAEHETLASTAKVLGTNFTRLHGDMDTSFGGALRDMTHYVQAIKALLKQREQRQIDYEALVEYLQRTEASHAAAQSGVISSSFLRSKVNDIRGVDKEHVRQTRTAKLSERMAELRTEVAKAKHVSNAFEEVAKREMSIFEATESLELQASLKNIADEHISLYEAVLTQCREIEQQYLSI